MFYYRFRGHMLRLNTRLLAALLSIAAVLTPAATAAQNSLIASGSESTSYGLELQGFQYPYPVAGLSGARDGVEPSRAFKTHGIYNPACIVQPNLSNPKNSITIQRISGYLSVPARASNRQRL